MQTKVNSVMLASQIMFAYNNPGIIHRIKENAYNYSATNFMPEKVIREVYESIENNLKFSQAE